MNSPGLLCPPTRRDAHLRDLVHHGHRNQRSLSRPQVRLRLSRGGYHFAEQDNKQYAKATPTASRAPHATTLATMLADDDNSTGNRAYLVLAFKSVQVSGATAPLDLRHRHLLRRRRAAGSPGGRPLHPVMRDGTWLDMGAARRRHGLNGPVHGSCGLTRPWAIRGRAQCARRRTEPPGPVAHA